MQAWRLLAIDLAKAHDDAQFVGIYVEGEGVEGNGGSQNGRKKQPDRTGHA
jgi:hypothetical protein